MISVFVMNQGLSVWKRAGRASFHSSIVTRRLRSLSLIMHGPVGASSEPGPLVRVALFLPLKWKRVRLPDPSSHRSCHVRFGMEEAESSVPSSTSIHNKRRRASSSTSTSTIEEAAARGGHIRGDFPNYYAFHSTTPRAQALLGDAETRRVVAALLGMQDQRAPLLLLSDWGSNAGDLTLEVARQLRQVVGEGGVTGVTVLGLELNAELVARAKALAAAQITVGHEEGGLLSLDFEAIDVVAEEERCVLCMKCVTDVRW